jgi:hypothetical protein
VRPERPRYGSPGRSPGFATHWIAQPCKGEIQYCHEWIPPLQVFRDEVDLCPRAAPWAIAFRSFRACGIQIDHERTAIERQIEATVREASALRQAQGGQAQPSD